MQKHKKTLALKDVKKPLKGVHRNTAVLYFYSFGFELKGNFYCIKSSNH